MLLILIWYWKRSYRPGASPFRLNVTDVPALPTKERIIFKNVPSTLSDENTVHQPYINKKKKLWHALQTSKNVVLRREKKKKKSLYSCDRNTNNECPSGQEWRLTSPDTQSQPIVWRALPAGLGIHNHKSTKTQSTVWHSQPQMKYPLLSSVGFSLSLGLLTHSHHTYYTGCHGVVEASFQ